MRVWDVGSGAELHCLRGHDRHVLGVACSTDGTQAFSVSSDETLRTWDLVAGRELRRPPGPAAEPTDAISDEEWDYRQWHEDRWEEQKEMYGLSEGLYCVALSPDGRTVAAGDHCWVVHLWDTGERKVARGFSHCEEWVDGVAFSPDGARLAYCGGDLSVVDLATGQEVFHKDLNSHSACSVAFSPVSGVLATGGRRDGTVRLWSDRSGEEVGVIASEPSGGVTCVAFPPPDGHRVVSSSRDTLVRVWEVKTGRLLATFRGHEDEVTSVAFAPWGEWIASASADGSVRLWDAAIASAEEEDDGHWGGVTTVDVTPNGRTAASGGEDSKIRLWDVRHGTCFGTLDLGGGRVKRVRFSADGRWLAGSYEESSCNDMGVLTDFVDTHRGQVIRDPSAFESQDSAPDLKLFESGPRAPFELRRSGLATALVRDGSIDPTAWLHLPISHHAASQDGLIHVAAVGNHVLILVLEDGSQSLEQVEASEKARLQPSDEDFPF